MTLSRDLNDPASPLMVFMNDALPDRHALVDDWRPAIAASRRTRPNLTTGDFASIGTVLEIRIGLDLTEHPSPVPILTYLPPALYERVLTAAGFVAGGNDTIDPHTVEPTQRWWTKQEQPSLIDEQQLDALMACYLADATFGETTRAMRYFPIESRRWAFRDLHGDDIDLRDSKDDEVRSAFRHLWTGYVEQGRDDLNALGDRVLVSPEMARGYAVADLVVDKTLVEIKTHAEPTTYLPRTIDQVIAYVLLDRWNTLRIDAVALYFGWEAVALGASLDEVLSAATRGATPDLRDLRAAFAKHMAQTLEDAEFQYRLDDLSRRWL